LVNKNFLSENVLSLQQVNVKKYDFAVIEIFRNLSGSLMKKMQLSIVHFRKKNLEQHRQKNFVSISLYRLWALGAC
jgi:hypothetical protein